MHGKPEGRRSVPRASLSPAPGAVLGAVDRVRRRAQDRDPRLGQRLPEVNVVALFVTAITFVPVLLAYRLMQRS